MDSTGATPVLKPGDRLDRYELLCPLAQGGMALVWLARFPGQAVDAHVVVKTILPQYAQDPRFQEMFLDEARIAAQVAHPTVARILDVGESGGSLYIVMEWVDGDSLSKLMRELETRKTPFPLGVAMRIAADLCAGLQVAHELRDARGELLHVVHRDVSPQNVLMSPSGVSKLIDFGVAKARDRVAQDTSVGQLKGKLRYMAPEQAKGGAIDARADLWSVGAVLYEMIVGEPAYDGPHELAILHKLTTGERPAPLPARVPPIVAAVVDRALCHDARARFGSMHEMGLALAQAMDAIGEPTPHAEVADFVNHFMTARRAARKKTVENALAAAARRDGRRARNDSVSDQVQLPPPNLEMASHASSATLGSTALPAGVTLQPEPDTGSRRLFAVAVGIASILIVVAGVGVGIVWRRSSATGAEDLPQVENPSSGTSESTAAPPPEPTTIPPTVAPPPTMPEPPPVIEIPGVPTGAPPPSLVGGLKVAPTSPVASSSASATATARPPVTPAPPASAPKKPPAKPGRDYGF